MGILIAIISICIPIVAIVSTHQYKLQKLKLEQEAKGSGVPAGYIKELERKMETLAAENKELKERMGNVETIIADSEFLLAPPSQKDEAKLTQEKIAQLANRSKG